MNTANAVAESPIEITHADLDEAYRSLNLRREGVGLVSALTSPCIYKALKQVAIARKKKSLAANASDTPLPTYSTLEPNSPAEALANIEVMIDGMDRSSMNSPAFIIKANLAYLKGYLGVSK